MPHPVAPLMRTARTDLPPALNAIVCRQCRNAGAAETKQVQWIGLSLALAEASAVVMVCAFFSHIWIDTRAST